MKLGRPPNPRSTNPPPPIPGKRFIPLTQGEWAIVDEADYEEVSKYNWCVTGKGRYKYATTANASCIYTRLHRLIAKAPDDMEVDHINGDSLDCSRDNIRVASHRDNIRNQKKHKSVGSSIYKGVCFDKARGKWHVSIYDSFGEKRNLGRFDSERDAAETYDEAARHYHGEFACVNFPKAGERGCI